ncbi:unnamed protein product [Ambrosiozyma monospora]|uniref:Unnamed protein product n=1 Tax=Ambrosiozyma monospora TaxID=43982 RepID=A0ACB5UBF3_AMBMO|nr:unnamed protein product [Ambrosiozyma monospora]
MSYHWSTTPFIQLYDNIQSNPDDTTQQQQQISLLLHDLSQLIKHPHKNDSSRKTLESGKVKFSDDLEYELNHQFKLDSIKLADDLNLDEISSAELLFLANDINNGNGGDLDLGVSLHDSAMANYYTRRQYILQILLYYICINSPLIQSNNQLKNPRS